MTSTGPYYDEKRVFLRMSVAADLTCRISGASKEFKGTCKNLSHSGIQFDTDTRLDEGTSLDVTIKTESDKFEPLKVVVEVLRVEPTENNIYAVAGRIVKYNTSGDHNQ